MRPEEREARETEHTALLDAPTAEAIQPHQTPARSRADVVHAAWSWFTVALALSSALILVVYQILWMREEWQESSYALASVVTGHDTSTRNDSLSWDGDDGSINNDNGDLYLLGVGKADITGPVVEINLMGYADPAQVGTGLRQRLHSRAFIVGDIDRPRSRWLYLVLDTQSGDTAIRHGILEALREMGGDYEMYGKDNVAVTGTHSHSGPGAWLNYLLPQLTSKGFDRQSYQAIVDGAVLSIKRAHERLAPGRLYAGYGVIENANINRSPSAYLANPEEEREKYDHNVEKTMTLLRFQRASDDRDLGILNWFPVHGTSMLGNNTKITGDNKGVAAYLFEKEMDGKREGDDEGDFVAGFSQANVGDTSPNVLGAYCEDGSGKECDYETSLCGGKARPCHGRGPYFGRDDGGTKSCYEIGRRQYEGARRTYHSPGGIAVPIRSGRTSSVKAFHTFHDLAGYSFPHPNGSVVKTCSAALGYSFAAGTTDGPGAFDFKQNDSGDPNANPVWKVVSGSLHKPTEEQKACQAPKPILLDVGATTKPYAWSPNIVDIQMLRVGQVFIIVSPGEATTMSGRRWKAAIASAARDARLTTESPIVVLGGPANTYTHYIATEEEYAVQRYEGASTLYGPHTLNAYINLTLTNLHYLSSDTDALPGPGPQPPIHTNKSLSFIAGVAFDRAPLFKSFGAVTTDVDASYAPGSVARAIFVGANPRNNLRLEGTYAAVERYDERTGRWTLVRDDSDWDLVFEWRRTSTAFATSNVEIRWEIPVDAAEELDGPGGGGGGGDERGLRGGYFRLRYHGDWKAFGTGKITEFSGVSAAFVLR